MINQTRMAYDDAGKGVPLVFLHGFPLCRTAWRKQKLALESTFRFIAPDLRGFGESEAPQGKMTMRHYADDVRALLQKLDVGPAVLVGHSMGGYVALAFALAYPNFLLGLVLVGTRSGNDAPDIAATRKATATKVKTGGLQELIDLMAPRMIAEQHPGFPEQVRNLMARANPEGVTAALLGMAERPDVTGQLSGITTPTLIIAGDGDVIIPPEESQSLSDQIQDSQLNIISRAGHLVAFEKPEEFNQILKDWIALKILPPQNTNLH